MKDIIDKFGHVSKADLYDLLDFESIYSDSTYGWYDLTCAAIIRTTKGYILELPKAVKLK